MSAIPVSTATPPLIVAISPRTDGEKRIVFAFRGSRRTHDAQLLVVMDSSSPPEACNMGQRRLQAMRRGWAIVAAIATCLATASAQPMAAGMGPLRSEPPGGLGAKPKPPGAEIHCTFRLCPRAKPDVINIHFVPHSHMDIASHHTFEANLRKATAILNSVSGELLKNKKRMFSVTEMAFLKKWYESSSEVFRIIFRKFVAEGRVELVSGGMVMNDEATTHYSDILDQMTLGMRWINATFGACALPRAVWQLDSYGHSREQAALFAQMGFDGLFLGRVHHLERRWRGNQDALEFVWHADEKLEWEIFTSILPHRYSPPGVVNFREFFLTEENKVNVGQGFIEAIETKTDDLESTNAERCQLGSTDCESVLYPAAGPRYGASQQNKPLEHKARQAPDSPPIQNGRGYQTQQRIVMFGDDFAYTNATVWYSQMDLLIDTINSMNGSRYNAFYSTPECYLRSVHEQWFRRKKGPSESALSYGGDFMPYSDRNFEWWTGYYSNRPQLKYHIRQASNFLQVCRQVTALLNMMEEPKIQKLEMAIAMAQHHDGITGTSSSEVVAEFTHRISAALDGCEEIVAKAIDTLATIGTKHLLFPRFCRRLNQSECLPSESLERFYVSVYNPQSVMVRTHVRFPVATSGYRVVNDQKAFVPSEIIPIQHALFHIPERNSTSFHDLVFQAAVPPLGVSTFLVQRFRGATFLRQQIKASERELSAGTDYVLKNKWYNVVVDSSSCLLKKVVLLGQNEHVALEQTFAGYSSEYGHVLFAPKEDAAEEFRGNATCRLVTSTIVQEVHQWFNPWLSQVIRLYVDQDYIEFDWIVGPIPTLPQSKLGYDVVTRFKSNLTNYGVFYTDSNGKQTIPRAANVTRPWDVSERNKRERQLVQSNYYPVVSWIYLRDRKKSLQMSVLPDRPQGGTAYQPGTIELMIHRRFMGHDGKGILQSLNDLGVDRKGLVVRGRHLLHLGRMDVAAVRVRQLANALVMAPVLAFSEGISSQTRSLETRNFRGLGAALPRGVQLLTLQQHEPKRVLFRLEYMQPAIVPREAPVADVAVPLHALMSTYQTTNVREVTLTASQWLDEQPEQFEWNVTVASGRRRGYSPRRSGDAFEEGKGSIIKAHMAVGEIRTFVADLVLPK
ncbi:hypothetical protein HPB50_001775 [Hyalomma asiaticum]|uniref:Uncharacterized protein n=1 Tax=Hyalomma asiaticum TaxID=266040 RepID=A0ACB7T7H8_HYAAI|nr:hypothetical protein HPB50_001775 [Hyalomma asiaticum]